MPPITDPTDPGFTAYATPARYTVAEKSLIGNKLFEAGAEVSYDGLPAENLIPTDEVGQARRADYEASNKARRARMQDTYGEQSQIGDPAAFHKAFQAALAEANAEHDKRIGDLTALVAQMTQNQQQLLAQLAGGKAKGKAAAADDAPIA